MRFWRDTETAAGRLTPQETVEKGHGRIERRRDALSDRIEWLVPTPAWAGLQAVGRVEATRLIGETRRTECRYDRCSFTDPTRFADAVRSHWASENGPHGVLDVQFGEDANRARQDHAAENVALVRRLALNVIRHNGPSKDRLRRRKLCASLNDDYRARLIFGTLST